MYSFMRLSNGVGLAANQVGFDLSLIVAEWQDRVFKLVNPCIVKKQGSISSNEGCLSFPGIELEIKRSERIWVSALNEKGEPVELEIEGILAVIFQHEIDHSEGKVFIERIPFWQKLKIHPKLEELSRRTRDGLRQQK
jgi:peptide deformylase